MCSLRAIKMHMLVVFLGIALIAGHAKCEQYQCNTHYVRSDHVGSVRVPETCKAETPSNCPRSWKSGVPKGLEKKNPLVYSEFLTCHEGFAKCGYVPLEKDGQVSGTSGVTIGAGVDLGSKSETYPPFRSISSYLLAKLVPYLGLKRNLAACAAIERPLLISTSEANNLTNEVKEYEANAVSARYNKDKGKSALTFSRLPRGIRTAIVSVWFQFGYPENYKNFWRYVTNNEWKSAVKELRNFYSDPSKQKTGDLRRRHNEADIIEATLEECNRAIDAVFLLDESGSVSDESFRKSLMFVENLITAFPDEKLKGENGTRFGLATFSSSYRNQFYLSTYDSQSRYTSAINRVVKISGGTYLGVALGRILTDQFIVSRGLRDEKYGLPRVLIVLTDGKASDDVVMPSQAVRSHNIVIYAIGIGNYDTTQLHAIASSKSHVYTLGQFSELETFVATLTAATCNEPQPITKGKTITQSVTQEQSQYFMFKIKMSVNLELTITDSAGETNVYMSRTNPHPYKYDNDLKFGRSSQKSKKMVLAGNAGKKRTEKRAADGEEVPIYVAIRANTDVAKFSLKGEACHPVNCTEGTNEKPASSVKPISLEKYMQLCWLFASIVNFAYFV